ncbi:MAG: type II CAAX endopeptidase family protein [Ilumatobacter sp.]|uniref:CPBP family intramembrane glutamic endopeptidase n=1 Tax=Ilumatobacter sp. TaxID=1967498 RepID=UPI003296AE15
MVNPPPPANVAPDRAPWPPPSTPMGVVFAPPRDPHPTLPLAAGVGAIVVLVVSLLGSKVVLDLIVDFEWPVVVYVALLGVLGYGPSVAWWWFSMTRWGSGNRGHDVGFTPRWSDLGWGPLIWLATIGVQVAVATIVLALDVPLANNTDDVGELATDRTYAVAIVITAVVAAPLVEELVFRGIVMRSLLSVTAAPLAVVGQGVLFGVAHVDPVRGVGNVGLAMVLSAVGVSFGVAAYLLQRIGPTMVAHAIFNGIVMIILLSGIRDRLLENDPDPFDLDTAPAGSVLEQVAVVDQAHVVEPHRGRDPHPAG